MRLRIRNPFYFVERDRSSMVTVLCYHCGNAVDLSYGNIRVSNYCSECK